MTKKISLLGIAFLAIACLFMPSRAFADDILCYDEEVFEETSAMPARAAARGVAARSAPTGQWVTFKTSTTSKARQVSDYYISPTANSDGSVKVTVRTTITHTASTGYSFFTTTKRLYDNGSECAFIGEDWTSEARQGQSISQQVDFSVRGGGSHHITSEEINFRDDRTLEAGWDFTIDIPYTITAQANTGGSISPSGYVLVVPGGSQTFTPKASSGYRIASLVVDGTPQANNTSYTFTNVSSNHTITANFQKVWTVTFVDGITGETLKTQVVDEGSSASAPGTPAHDGWQSTGWDKDFSKITANTTVKSTYTAIIKVRVPTLLSCQILADGTVVTPNDYAIENLSVVNVKATSITTSDIPSDASYTLSDGGSAVHSWSGGDKAAKDLLITAASSKQLSLSISPVTGSGAWRELAQRAASGTPQTYCNLSYVFSQA